MEASDKSTNFERLSNVGVFDVTGKTLLIPDMVPFGSRLAAASFRAFDVDAHVMETYTGLSLGKEFTSGKECFPCQVTLGDILYHLKKEKERLGAAFDPERYVYFLPEADGPCRFGMYNKMQSLVLERFPEFRDVRIAFVTTKNAYSPAGLLPPQEAGSFRRVIYISTIIADVMDRIVWRVRPYELRPGMTDEFMEQAMRAMEETIARYGAERRWEKFYELLEDVAATAKTFIDDRLPRRPKIGIIGEIYVRTHPDSNQHLIRQIERYGGEVVDSSIGEWINYISYDHVKDHYRGVRAALRRCRHEKSRAEFRKFLKVSIDYIYQYYRMKQVYSRALRHLDVQPDHTVPEVEKRLDNDRLFAFEVGTETVLSVGGALEFVHGGFDGIVNVFPFTCMPSTMCSAILKPILLRERVPYLDASYDGTFQPNRDTALRTFVYQAQQHMERRMNGRVPK
jgi:predicted nucleotide-binding protein (sugar kinase/HSP70/actin superfamily)